MPLPLAVLAALAFISLGLPDGLLGVAWPSIRAFFGRDLEAVGVLLMATMGGYVGSSFSSGRLLRRLNVGAILSLSCGLTAAALLGYAASAYWWVVVALGIVLGAGGGAIDSSLNTFAATHYGARTLNWLHACYGIGAATGPLVMTAVLARGLPWQRGYAMVGLAQLGLAACFAATMRRWDRTADVSGQSGDTEHATIPATLRRPGAWLGILTFFVYAGVEASMGVWTYTLLTEGRGVAPVRAAAAVSLFWAGLTIGRLLMAIVPEVPPRIVLWSSLACVALGTALVWLDANAAVTWGAVLMAGLACGPIFPTLVAVTPQGMGAAHAANAVGFQIAAAALGLSVLPGLVGLAAGALGVEAIATSVSLMALLLMAVYGALERAWKMSPQRTQST